MAKSGDPFRDLLVAELAVVLDVASAKEVGAAVESYWSKRDRLDASFGERLARVAGIEAEDLERLEAQVDGLVREAGGDTRRALLTHGGIDRSLRRALPADSLVSREVDALEPELRQGPSLRPMAADRYERLAVLGKGGMGVVVLAHDRELQRQVALKIMRPPEASTGSGGADRFLREAQITGSLEHPGIVPIHEIGRTGEEAPYYTMRHVAGRRTLLDAIRESATVADRLALLEPFLRICDTVRYAHSRGVLHCDIKPANIALGAFGETILLDWGLARATGEDRASAPSTSGTPGYASPEAAGALPGDVTERSDVYGLGATLFHILTATVPFEFGSLEALRHRLAVEPAPKAAARAPGVPEALSRLCERALAPDPADRFPDVAALADAVRAWRDRDEIERELAGLAREADRALADAGDLPGVERLSRLDRVAGLVTRMRELDADSEDALRLRERAAQQREGLARQRERESRSRLLKRVAVAALLVATTTAAIMAWVLENRRAETESARREASAERDRAEDLADFMLGDLHYKLAGFGRHELLAAAARKTLAYYDSVASPDTAAARRKKAAALSHVAGILRKEGSLDDAMVAGRQATAILEELHAEQPRDLAIGRDLARSHRDAIRPLHEAGDSDGAMAAARRALELQRRVREASPREPVLRAEQAATLLVVSNLRQQHADLRRAIESCEQALGIQRALVAEYPEDPLRQTQLAYGLRTLASLRREQGKMDEAVSAFKEALGLLDRLREPDSHALRESAELRAQLGDLHLEHERFEEAREQFDRALAVRRDLARANPLDLDSQHALGLALLAVARVHWRDGDRAAAWEPAREAAEVFQRLADIDPANRFWSRELADALHELGDMHRTMADHAKALEYFERAAELRRTLHETAPTLLTTRDLATGLTALGRGYSDCRQFEQAVACFAEAEELLRRLADEDPTNSRDLHSRSWNAYWLADAYRFAGKTRVAHEHYLAALTVFDQALAVEPNHPRLHCNVAEIHCWIGDLLRKTNDRDRALHHYTLARDVAAPLCAREDPGWRSLQALARAQGLRGVVLLEQGKYKAAAEAFRHAARENRRLVAQNQDNAGAQAWYDGRVRTASLLAGEAQPESAADHALLGEHAHHAKRHEEAVAHFRRAFVDARVQRSDEYLDYAVRSSAQVEAHRDQALAWLRVAVQLQRRRIAWADDALANEQTEQRRVALTAQRDRWRRHLDFLRDEDPQLAPIRDLPGFREAFEVR